MDPTTSGESLPGNNGQIDFLLSKFGSAVSHQTVVSLKGDQGEDMFLRLWLANDNARQTPARWRGYYAAMLDIAIEIAERYRDGLGRALDSSGDAMRESLLNADTARPLLSSLITELKSALGDTRDTAGLEACLRTPATDILADYLEARLLNLRETTRAPRPVHARAADRRSGSINHRSKA